MKTVDLQQNFEQRKQKWPWLISKAKKHFDIWASQKICMHFSDFKLSHIPFIANINPAGSTNNEIAQNALVAKQGMSRTIKELEEHDLIITQVDQKDKRSSKIKLSKKGEKFMTNAIQEVEELTLIYKVLVGEKKYNIALEVIAKIVAYHENLNLEIEE